MPKIAGNANAMPDIPTQNDCDNTIMAMRQRGMPRARKTAYSLSDATVAECSVVLVTTAPTSNPRSAASPSAMPAFVLNSQCNWLLLENCCVVNGDSLRG